MLDTILGFILAVAILIAAVWAFECLCRRSYPSEIQAINDELTRLDFLAESIGDQLRRGDGDAITLIRRFNLIHENIRQLEAELSKLNGAA